MKTSFALLLIGMLASTTAVARPAQPLQGLDAYVHKAMAQWNVPGLSIAVVKDGKVVLAKGYGVRELDKPGKVDADTLFTIGSNTKVFTAAALGTLVSAHKLNWNAPVIDYVKQFRLRSPYVTRHITLRDLLTHRSGYCDPGMWYTSDADDVIERLRYQKPDYGFRARFCYNNIMFLTAARFIPAITGKSWNHYVKVHLLEPLGMTRTVTNTAALAAATNVARPHGMVNGKLSVIRRYWPHNADVMAPVGFINSSANDMSHWLLMLLAEGRYQDKTILKPAIVEAIETPQMLIEGHRHGLVGRLLDVTSPASQFRSYGLGVFVNDYNGRKLVWHAGDINGMSSAFALVPGAHFGVVVLTNMSENGARFGVLMHVIESYLGLPHRDASKILYASFQREKRERKAAEKELAATREQGAEPPKPLKAYAGLYRDKFDGAARVTLENNQLVLRLENPSFTGQLEHWHDNTFRVTWRYRYYGESYVTFELDSLGGPAKLTFARMPLHYERSTDAN